MTLCVDQLRLKRHHIDFSASSPPAATNYVCHSMVSTSTVRSTLHSLEQVRDQLPLQNMCIACVTVVWLLFSSLHYAACTAAASHSLSPQLTSLSSLNQSQWISVSVKHSLS